VDKKLFKLTSSFMENRNGEKAKKYLTDPEAADRDVGVVPGGRSRYGLPEQAGRLSAARHMLLQQAAQHLTRGLVQLSQETGI
jgi:hypothetical protein